MKRNPIAMALRSPMLARRVVRSRKGRGSYDRKKGLDRDRES